MNPESTPTEMTAKRVVSKRANRGINPKYGSDIYSGVSGGNVQN